MRELLTQIKKGLDGDLYYLFLLSALITPDLCGALESDNGEAS